MVALRNHPEFWMRADAEASLARWEADHGKIGVNSAGRYEWEQQEFINRWNQGGKYNRPPYLYEPKRPARASAHVANGGRAFDTSEYVRFLNSCRPYGWRRTYDWDIVHFEYFPEHDIHKNRPAGGGSISPAPTPIPVIPEEEDEDMKGARYTNSGGQVVQVLFNDVSGFYSEYAGNNPASNSEIAQAWKTDNWVELTASVAGAIKASCQAVRSGK